MGIMAIFDLCNSCRIYQGARWCPVDSAYLCEVDLIGLLPNYIRGILPMIRFAVRTHITRKTEIPIITQVNE